MQIFYPQPQKWGYSYFKDPANEMYIQNYTSAGLPNGNPSKTTYTSAFALMLRRDKRSSNPIVYVLPQRVPWRRPSSYVRTAIQCRYDQGDYWRKHPVTGVPIRHWYGLGPQVGTTQAFGPHISASYEAILSSNTLNRLNTEVLLKLKDMKVNFGEAIAEMRSTVRGVSSTASQVVTGLLAARRGNWAGVAKALRVKPKSLANGGTFSERWLEYQFGWMPLLSDIKGGYDLFNEGLHNRGLIFSATRSYSDTVEFSTQNANWDIEGESTVQGRVKIYAAVDNAKLSALTSLGLADPLQVAWALVPYSFVVDWFMPVGNLLEAIGATRGLTFVGGFTSVRVTSSSRWKYIPEAQLGGVYEGDGFTGASSVEAYSRTAMSTWPMPSLYVKSPFSMSHLTSAGALLRQLFKSK